jgi:IclR family acetate operon transcriptional repressor
VKNKPAYGIDSVDHALSLAVLLRQEGPLGVTEAATRLGVARSTAHRLLAMLVYRDFAEQNADRRYAAGPMLRRPVAAEPVAGLRRLALPHLRELVERCGETVSIQVLIDDRIRFVATVECGQILRVKDREGRLLPAHLASGGCAILACLPHEEVVARYAAPGRPKIDVERLRRDLARVRRQGFSVNDQNTETGVTAIGRVVRNAAGTAVAGVSIAMPTVRYSRDRLADWVQMLTTTASGIEQDVAAAVW